uniref:Reverse transcriptase/retrotransposon-derived protein RNase H-like domain-containing protein n=1 Tax=Latimeria chalumnae TaxID=7897 RepID=H3AQB0_LATCH
TWNSHLAYLRKVMNYVGLKTGAGGLQPQANHIQAIRKMKSPTNLKELCSSLGVNYPRQFICDYSRIAQPLFSLLRKDILWTWESNKRSVKELKKHLNEVPCLAYPRPGKEFYIKIGCSEHSISAILCQE